MQQQWNRATVHNSFPPAEENHGYLQAEIFLLPIQRLAKTFSAAYSNELYSWGGKGKNLCKEHNDVYFP
jgi:hypothetical protein